MCAKYTAHCNACSKLQKKFDTAQKIACPEEYVAKFPIFNSAKLVVRQ